jgi:hypothetical protein
MVLRTPTSYIHGGMQMKGISTLAPPDAAATTAIRSHPA